MSADRDPNTHATRLMALAALFLALMAALHLSRQAVRVEAQTRAEDPRKRGRAYEAHVFAAHRLPEDVRAAGGRIRLHSAILPPDVTEPAEYFTVPRGFGAGAEVDPTPHPSALRHWPARGPGGIRIPDAIISEAEQTTLVELKCPSPWLTFGSGTPWAARMQDAFASQAVAFFAWTAERQNRALVYGFCGRVPPWASEILDRMYHRFGVQPEVVERYYATDFEPAQRFVESAAREVFNAAALGAASELAPEAVVGPTYDLMED